MRAARIGQWAVSVGIGVWIATLLAAPAWLFPVGSFICHQRPERSFFIDGSQVAVCARCTGLYVGGALAAPWGLIAASTLASSRARRILMLASIPTALTWTLEFAGLLAFSNVARFIAALPLGFAAAWLVVSVVGDGQRRDQRSSASVP